MKDKIKELIQQQKTAKIEVEYMLEELNQIDSSKLSLQEINDLQSLISKYTEESCWRGVFISQLQDLL